MKLSTYNSKFNSKSGFTLIEMLIVIAVIAILAGVVLTGVGGFQASARDTRRMGDLRNTQNFLELFFNKCGHYPVSGSSATSCGTPSGTGTLGWTSLQGALSGVTSSSIPNDPLSGRAYQYGYKNGGTGYVLRAGLERDNNSLKEDIDSSGVSGINCADSSTAFNYCIGS